MREIFGFFTLSAKLFKSQFYHRCDNCKCKCKETALIFPCEGNAGMQLCDTCLKVLDYSHEPVTLVDHIKIANRN